jgi:dimethylsulfoniopropionate demethylase
VTVEGRQVGQITSGIWSPRLERNVGLSLIDREFWDVGQTVRVHVQNGSVANGQISALPIA